MFDQRERASRIYMMIVSLAGWLLLVTQLGSLHLHTLNLIYFGLFAFLFIMEYFPLQVWKGTSTLSFPVIYTLYIIYGIELTLLSYSIAILLVTFLKKRPLRVMFFNPAQLMLSIYLAVKLVEAIVPPSSHNPTTVAYSLLVTALTVIFFNSFNNLFVDIVLWLRPHPYRFKHWLRKATFEAVVALFVFLYLGLMVNLGHQNRGIIDFFSFFFFFSPLVAISIVGSIINRLQQEQSRLRSLYRITTNLTKNLTLDDWMSTIIGELKAFLFFDSSLLFLKQRDEWSLVHTYGFLNIPLQLTEEDKRVLDGFQEIALFLHRDIEGNRLEHLFSDEIHSFAYAPLLIEEEHVGLWAVGRSRTHSFRQEDKDQIAMIANQLAIVKKSRSLMREQKNLEIIEERNRIARVIHDGIAQSLAGVILNLETAHKKRKTKPEEAFKLMDTSIDTLRDSLKEVRESIYQLRPNSNQPVSFLDALPKRLEHFQCENGIETEFELRGHPYPLSVMVGQVLDQIVQEALRNVVKHAKADHVQVLVSFQQDRMILKIKDNGIGFSLLEAMLKAKEEPHFGILNINELSEKLGASLHINSQPNQGADIQVIIPKLEGVDRID